MTQARNERVFHFYADTLSRGICSFASRFYLRLGKTVFDRVAEEVIYKNAPRGPA